MERNNRYMSMLRIVLLFVVGILLQVGHVAMGQVKEYGAQISDGSTPPLQPITFSILELNSKERGFLMPRMTTIERDRMVAADLTEGMTIYNLTLDCIEFYNGTRKQWMNVCGGSEPAVYVIPELKCGTIKVNGDYMADVLLSERTHNLIIEVNVSTPGAFDVEAIAYDDAGQANGYVFTTSGVFPTAGDFVLVLRGKGTPKKGYAPGTGQDIVKFKLNKKEVSCTVKVDVAKGFEPLAASMDCTKAKAEGTYKIDVPLTSTNKIIVDVTVTKNGRGRIYGTVPLTGGQNETIKYESDLIDFSTKNSPVKVELRPTVDSGKPNISGPMRMNLRLETRGKHEYDFLAPSEPKDIAVCSFNIDVEGDWAKYKSLSFQLVTPFVAKTGPKAGTNYYYITPRTTLDGDYDFYIVVKITPTSAGKWYFKTNKINNIYFEGGDKFTATDINKPQTVYLYGKGTTGVDMPTAQTFQIEDNKGTVIDDFTTDFVYRPMKMYSVGREAWHPGGSYGAASNDKWEGGPALVYNTNHFGWNGAVRIDGLTIIDPSPADKLGYNLTGASAYATRFSALVDQADMVFIGAALDLNSNMPAKGATQMTKLYSWITGSKTRGVLVYGEGRAADLTGFVSKFSGVLTLSGNGNFTVNEVNRAATMISYNDTKSSNAERIIQPENSRLAGIYPITHGGIAGKLMGSQENIVVNTKASIFGPFEVIAKWNAGGDFAFVHDTYGFVGVTSSTFMGGTREDVLYPNSYPTRGDLSGKLLTAPYTKLGPSNNMSGRIYNGALLLNLIHWAIDYAQENQPNVVK